MTEPAQAGSVQYRLGFGLTICSVYIVVSAAMIDFNKYLVHRDRFPFAMTLTMFHMLASCVLCFLFYLLNPSMYPGMERTKGKRLKLLKWFVPLGALFAVALFLGNQAYLYCSVAFLQFMKESNIVIVFTFSCLVGMQVATRAKMVVILWIVAGASMAVQGEVRFVMMGFAFQAIAQVAECSKNVMGEWLLSGSDVKLDPLTYTMFMAPVCLITLIIGNIFAWDPEIIPRVMEWWPYLIPNACLAFCLNVSVAVLIKECSAIGFLLSGLVKDIFIVTVSSMVFGDTVAPQQIFGFSVTLTGIFFWSCMKIAPDSGVVQRFNAILGVPPKEGKGTKELARRPSEERPPLISGTGEKKV